MAGPPLFLKACATPRGLVLAAVAVGAFAALSHFAMIPAYRQITGFAPFDVQFPLSRFGVAVVLGAIGKGAATQVYVLFAITDLAYAAATAWFFTLLWVWLFAKVPMRLFATLTRGGILLLPSYVVVTDLAAKAGFFRLLGGLSGPSYGATIEFSVMAHRVAFALMDLRNYLTGAFLLLFAFGALARWRAKPASSAPPFPS